MTRLLSHTIPALPLICSLGCNTIGDKGALALATILNETKITQLRCATAPECLPSYGCVNIGEHLSSLRPFSTLPPSTSLLPAPFRILIRAMLCRVDRVDRTVRPPAERAFPVYLPRPSRSPRRSLRSNGISDQAKQAVRDAAGNGVSIIF